MGIIKRMTIAAREIQEPLPRYLEEQRHRYNVERSGKLVIIGAELANGGSPDVIAMTPNLTSRHDSPIAVLSLNYYLYVMEQGKQSFVGNLLLPYFDRAAIVSENSTIAPMSSIHFSEASVTAIQFRSAKISDKTGNWGFVPVEAIMLRDPVEPSGWRMDIPKPLRAAL